MSMTFGCDWLSGGSSSWRVIGDVPAWLFVWLYETNTEVTERNGGMRFYRRILEGEGVTIQFEPRIGSLPDVMVELRGDFLSKIPWEKHGRLLLDFA